MKNKELKALSGCLMSTLHLVIALPMWFYFLFWILSLISAPTGLYILYWSYLAVTVVLAVVGVFLQAIADA